MCVVVGLGFRGHGAGLCSAGLLKVVYNEITTFLSKTGAVRSVVVSLALHARGRGFNPHTVQ